MTPPSLRRWLNVLFFLSGTAGLLYEVVWMRMLVRVFGVTAHATSAVVSVFLGGLALGAWLGGRSTASRRPSLRLYAALEVAAGLCALVSTEMLRRLPGWYASLAPDLGPGAVAAARLALSAAVLAPPTVLLGATLPILARWATETDEAMGPRLAALYGVNTFGAAAGALAAGFVLLAAFGERGTVLAACVLSLLVGAAAFALSPSRAPAQAAAPAPPAPPPALLPLTLAAASGFCSLALEILWTRLLVPLMGSSVYAFSSMLSLYLAGIALGSLIARGRPFWFRAPAAAFGWILCSGAVLAVSSLHLYRALGALASHPNYLYSPLRGPGDLAAVFAMGACIILPVTMAFGMSFPVLGRLLTPDFRVLARSVGTLYAANTAGGILGALAAGFWLIPALGVQKGFLAVSGLLLAVGLAALWSSGEARRPWTKALAALWAAGALAAFSPDAYLEILARRVARSAPEPRLLFHREEAAATVTGYSTRVSSGTLLINGILVSDKGLPGALMAHLPLLLVPDPGRALVVCIGTGNTLRAASEHVAQVDAVELVKGVVDSLPFFYGDVERWLTRPGVRVFVDDGRHFLMRSRGLYDAIVVDGSPPLFAAGTVNLYTQEFIRLASSRLKPRGVLALWVPTPCFPSDFWMIARNFTGTFPHVRLWTHPRLYGILLLGSDAPLDTGRKELARRIRERGLDKTAPWLDADLVAEGFLLTEEELRDNTLGAPSLTDDKPRTEFPLASFARRTPYWWNPTFVLYGRRRPSG